MLNVKWQKCQGDVWCSLVNLNLESVSQKIGVYLIWHEGNPGVVVKVGQGDIVDRLAAHRRDPEILSYGKRGTLRITWASVDARYLDGVERYLGETWPPLVGSRFPEVAPIAVNSPF